MRGSRGCHVGVTKLARRMHPAFEPRQNFDYEAVHGEGSPYVHSLGNPSPANTGTLHDEPTKGDIRGARNSSVSGLLAAAMQHCLRKH